MQPAVVVVKHLWRSLSYSAQDLLLIVVILKMLHSVIVCTTISTGCHSEDVT